MYKRLVEDAMRTGAIEERELAGFTDEGLLHRLEEHLRAHNEAHQNRGYRLALSVGIARFEPDSSWSIDQLLEHADKALYAEKRQRRQAE